MPELSFKTTENSDILWEVGGKRLFQVEATTSTNKIGVKVDAIRTDKYIFYIQGPDDTDYVKKAENEIE